MKSIGQALREIVPCVEPVGVVRVPLHDALGKVLAEDVLASADLPGFDNSAMDGYAVRHVEAARGAALPLSGEARAGGTPPALPPATAIRIFTGAPMPEGADTVIIQENAQRDGESVRFTSVPATGANVRRRASDLAAGSLALAQGQRVGAGEIGLLAAQHRASVCVYQSPRVALLATGDELREIGQPCPPGAIVNSNVHALAAQLRELGAEPWVLPTAADDLDDLCSKLEQALRADAVITAGGVSVGEYDLVGRALQACGVELKLWKVAIRPGKPLLFAMRGRVPVFGLPGNPVSAMVTFEVFVKPALRRMLGHAAPYPALVGVELEHDHRHSTGRTELARVQLLPGANGGLRARLHPLQGSGSLPAMCGIDALLVLPADRAQFERGSRLSALLLNTSLTQREPPFE